MSAERAGRPRPRIVVVGAGIGGLTTAIRLARAGAAVTVVEASDVPGGKMGEHREAGFRFDTGPSVVTMRGVFEELFAAAGSRLADELTLEAVDPLTRYIWPGGTVLDLPRDVELARERIRAIDPADADGYVRFLDHARRLHDLTGRLFIYGPPPTLRSFTSATPANTLRLAPWRTLHGSIARYVRSPEMRQLLGRFATYVGADPYRAPAALGVIAHVELNEGVWYPRGGVRSIADALVRTADRLGVEIRTGSRVDRIEVADGRAGGVVLAGGARLPADAVVSNADIATTLGRLVPTTAPSPRRVRALFDAEPSFSGFVLLAGVRGGHERLAHHTVLFSPDYRAEFRELSAGRAPADPTVYLALTCRTDPADAPAGHENWFVLVNAPPLPADGSDPWAGRAADAYGARLLERIRAFGIGVAPEDLVVRRTIAPSDIADRTGAHRGALYGPSSSHAMAAFRRPRNRDPRIRGLYHVGGSTHPGGGVPMVMLSGRYVASLVGEDLGFAVPDAGLALSPASRP